MQSANYNIFESPVSICYVLCECVQKFIKLVDHLALQLEFFLLVEQLCPSPKLSIFNRQYSRLAVCTFFHTSSEKATATALKHNGKHLQHSHNKCTSTHQYTLYTLVCVCVHVYRARVCLHTYTSSVVQTKHGRLMIICQLYLQAHISTNRHGVIPYTKHTHTHTERDTHYLSHEQKCSPKRNKTNQRITTPSQ